MAPCSPAYPTLAVPGEVYEVSVDLWFTSYVIEPGHSIRIDVSSSNAPRFNVNGNNGLLVREQDTMEPVVATNPVHLSSSFPSRVELPIVSLADLPENYHPRENVQSFEQFIEDIMA